MSIVKIAVETLKIAADLIEILSKDTEHEGKAKELLAEFNRAKICLPEPAETHIGDHGN